MKRALGELGENLRMCLTALSGNRLRTALTTLGIAIGVTTVIAIVAIIQGLNASFAEQVSSFGANTLYVAKHTWMDLEGNWYLQRNRQPIGRKELTAIERQATLALAVAPQMNTMASVTAGGRELSRVQITGTNAEYPKTGGGSVGAGRFLAEADVELARPVAVIGADVADQAFERLPWDQVLGKRVQIGGRSFSVIGVMDRRGRFLGMSLDNNAFVPHTVFRRLFGTKRSMNIAVTGAPERLAALEDELTGILRTVRRVPADKADDFTINRQDQFLKVYRGLTAALYAVAFGVGLITLIVGGIGIMNIMLVSVHERTREIGLRRALGARRRTVMTQFLLEAIAVSLLGGGVGTVFGLAIAQLVALLSPLAAAVTPSATALGLGFSAAVGLVFGSWPAWRAANLDPVEALRYE